MNTDSMKSHLCNICDKEFIGNSNLVKHMREVHILDDDDQNRHYKSVQEEQEKVALPSSKKLKSTTSIKLTLTF